jgi:glycosyltransferase involved in cell wall biosynthesis
VRFFVVTPVLNGAGKIGRTVASIVGQHSVVAGDDSLRYVVMDGGSTDATVDEARAAGGNAIEVQSGPDAGLYDALAQALPRSDGDVTLYLGAGDVLEPTAFQIVSTILTRHPDVHWLTGRATARNGRQEIVNSVLPHPFHRRYFACGMYGTRLPVLQQESTFWRTGLQRAVDFRKLATTTLAGDYLLWKSFAELAELYVVNAVLGSFTQEPGQLSVSGEAGAYLAELRQLRRRPTIAEELAALLLRIRTKHRVPRRSVPRLFSYDFRREEWRLRRL